MTTITSQLSAVSSTLRLYNPEKRALNLEFVIQGGRVLAPAETGYPKELQSISLEHPHFTSWLQSVTVGRIDDPEAPIPNALRFHLLALGVRSLLIIPLISNNRPIGCLMFRFVQERDFNAEELEIARALATQAALAIQLTQLARTAKQSAVLEERNRLAGEIHDSLAQGFAGISMQPGCDIGHSNGIRSRHNRDRSFTNRFMNLAFGRADLGLHRSVLLRHLYNYL